MNIINSFASNIKYFYNTINPASLTGAIDVIVVEQPDGRLCSTPFHVRFGKYGVFNSSEKYLDIKINNKEIKVKMKLGENGVAYFVQETDETEVPEYLASSPIPGSPVPASPVTSNTAFDQFGNDESTEKKKALKRKSDTNILPSQQIDREPSAHGKKAKMKQPISSSIFSNQRIRSLPDISQLEDDNNHDAETPVNVVGEIKPSSFSHSNIIDDDGAVSDSEVDRKIKLSSDFHDDDTVWKWGEFPQSTKAVEVKKENESKAAKASKLLFSWFSGRSAPPPQPKGDEVYLDDLVNKEANPDQMKKYFGRTSKKSSDSTVSSSDDDGNEKSDHNTQLASPSALSIDSLNTDQADTTPIKTPAEGEIKRAVEKKTAIEIEMLAGTDQYDNKPTAKFTKEIKEREKSGNSKSDASIISEEEPVPMAQTSYIRSLRLSSDELKSLQLQYGSNEAKFSVTTKFQGTSWCTCHIYLFKYSDRIVISDIDGTITKSDFRGHIIAAFGGQWAHAGVAELYSRIKQNGYKMVYLSSRAIGQSHYTKLYLQSLAQGSKSLPDGPVLLSPMSVLMAFKKEIIERKPEEFKIACLSDLRSLFPVKHPFYAGFGNRETDIRSYAAVDIPAERILIVNPSGTVKRADADGFSSSYSMMAMEMVDYLFPPLHLAPSLPQDGSNIVKVEKMHANFTKPETCSSFTHWRSTDTVLIEDELAVYERKRKEKADMNKKAAKFKKIVKK